MTKSCPNCDESVPDNAHFCPNCGYDFVSKESNVPVSTGGKGFFSDGRIFLVLIAIVVIVGVVVLATTLGGNHSSEKTVEDNVAHVKLTISDVSGSADITNGKNSYFLWTEALFTDVPSDQKGYIIKTIYYDENDTALGQETETLSNVYYETDYPISFGYHTTYKKPNLDHVNVEIIKDGKTIDTFTEKINQAKISFLN